MKKRPADREKIMGLLIEKPELRNRIGTFADRLPAGILPLRPSPCPPDQLIRSGDW